MLLTNVISVSNGTKMGFSELFLPIFSGKNLPIAPFFLLEMTVGHLSIGSTNQK